MLVPEWLVRHATFPLYERLRGRRTLHEMRELQWLAGLPPQTVQRECVRRLRGLLAFAADKLPYYAEAFARHGLDLAATDPLEQLGRLPVLRKADVRRNTQRMICRTVPGGLQACVSGGTSGDTLHFYVDRLRQAQSMGARLFMQSLFGVQPGDRRMWLWGSPLELKAARLRRWRDRLLNEIVLDAFDMSAACMDEYLKRIAAYRPRLIIGYSSAVTLLARHAAARYGPRDFPWLRVVVLTGDEVEDQQRAAIGGVFGCPVASEYGSREVGLIAHDCPRGRLHVISPHVYLEITHNDERVEPGICGAITCTNLNTRAQPLIRYHLGDAGRLSAGGCECGLPLPVLEIVGGRITGFVALPDGSLRHGHLVAYLVRAEECVTEFKVRQRALGAFEILLVIDPRCAPADVAISVARIQTRFRQYFGERVRVDCQQVGHIPPDPSGKRRHLISDVATQFEGAASLR